MNENRRQILEMLKEGRITVEEAERLIAALRLSRESADSSVEPGSAAKPKYLRILVESDESHEHGHGAGMHGHTHASGPTKVNIRIPMQLLRAGVKLVSLIPVQAREHVNEALRENGVALDINQIKPENLEELIEHIRDLTVDVDEKHNKVKIFCE